MKQFKRVYRLTIGNDKESVVINGLRVTFEIKKTINSDPNQANFGVYNLSESNRNLVADKSYNRIQFEAGYQDGGMKTLFVGWIDSVDTVRDGMDFVTMATCADGAKDYRESVTAKTVKKGSTDKQAVAEIMQDMPNTQKGIIDIDEGFQLPRGKVFFGNSRDMLNKIAKNQNADWSIQDGDLVFFAKDKAIPNSEGFLISKDTGMIGSPTKNSDGLEVRCFLNNIMQIGQLCRVASEIKAYSGDFKIISNTMAGDTHGADFMNILTLQNGEFKKAES